MDEMNKIINFLFSIIPIGTTMIILICLFKIKLEENPEIYKKRIKHAIVFLVVSLLIWKVKDIVIFYFGNPMW